MIIINIIVIAIPIPIVIIIAIAIAIVDIVVKVGLKPILPCPSLWVWWAPGGTQGEDDDDDLNPI